MFENVSPITLRQINGAAYCCLASGLEPRAFAHSAVTDCLNDVCVRVAPDGTVHEFYLNETVAFFNAEKGREEVGIALPLRSAQPLISLAYFDEGNAAGTSRALQALFGIESVLRKLYRLFSCLLAAYQQGSVSEAFFRDAVSVPLCLLVEGETDGGAQALIVLPPRLTLRCVTAQPEAALRFHYPWVHPDGERATLEAAVGFFLAALSYACITGAPPFTSAAVPFAAVNADEACGSGAAERLVQNIRDGVYVPVALRCPQLLAQCARLIDSGLCSGLVGGCAGVQGQGSGIPLWKGYGQNAVSSRVHLERTAGSDILSDRRAALPLVEQLCRYRDESLPLFAGIQADGQPAQQQPDVQKAGVQDQATPTKTAPTKTAPTKATLTKVARAQAAENSAQQAALEAFIQTARKRINRKRFIRRNRGKIAATAVLCAALIAVTAASVAHIRKPPATAGLSAEAVIRGFYTAVGTLDQTITGAYTKHNAGASYDNLIVYLYVTGKTREAYERKKIYYTPQEFFTLCKSVLAADAAGSDAAGNNAMNVPPEQERDRAAKLIHDKQAVVKLLNGGSVYGISSLTITPAAQTGWFDVRFYHWLPVFSSEEAEAAAQPFEAQEKPQAQNVQQGQEASASASDAALSERLVFPVQVLYKHDRVQVISVKGSFFIGVIESIESAVVVASSNALLDDCLAPSARRPDYVTDSEMANE